MKNSWITKSNYHKSKQHHANDNGSYNLICGLGVLSI